MPTIADPETRAALLARIGRLSPDTQPSWGMLTSPRLLCHLADQMRVALGEIAACPTGTLLTRTLLKWLVIYAPTQPPPGRVQTAPEMLTSVPTSWVSDLAAVESLVERLARAERVAPHPAFGPLTQAQWCRLTWRHTDHHLRQFGL